MLLNLEVGEEKIGLWIPAPGPPEMFRIDKLPGGPVTHSIGPYLHLARLLDAT